MNGLLSCKNATTSSMIQIVIAQGDVDFVEQNELDLRDPESLFGLFPACRARRQYRAPVLGFPGKAFARHDELALVAKRSVRNVRSPVAQLPLMNCTTAQGISWAMQRMIMPKPTGRFALARPRVDNDQTLLFGLGLHHAVTGGFDLFHLSRCGGCFRSVMGCSVESLDNARAAKATPCWCLCLEQVKRECDRGRLFVRIIAQSAAAPATVTGEVAPQPLAQSGREGSGAPTRPRSKTGLTSASRETCQRRL